MLPTMSMHVPLQTVRKIPMIELNCPVPQNNRNDHVQLAHGEGNRLMRQLLQDVILPPLDNVFLQQGQDACTLPQITGELAFTTDSYVVSPLTFPGGDIGSLAVYGTCNDLAVTGAKPLWLSLSLIIEEGFAISTLRIILNSIAEAARVAEVKIVTGDTKVVPKGVVDGLFINTSGIGDLIFPTPGPKQIQPGDAIILSGPIARHGTAILAARENIEVTPLPESDTGSLFPAVAALQTKGVKVRAMRDCTRGGVTAVLHEWAQAAGCTIAVQGSQIPLLPQTRGLCELLGLEPLHIACEGTMAIVVEQDDVELALDALKALANFSSPGYLGEVLPQQLSPVVIRRSAGQVVPLDEPWGAPLPRIC